MLEPTDGSVATVTLERLHPFRRYTPEALREVAANAAIRDLRAGTVLFRADDRDDWTLYVLEGQVELQYPAGTSDVVDAQSPQGARPLLPVQPRAATAQTRTDSRVLRVATSLLDVLAPSSPDRVCTVEEIADDPHLLTNRLLIHLFEDYASNRLEIPLLPDVAMHVRQAVQASDSSIGSVARIASRDPSVAARLIRVANSPAYGGTMPVNTCRDAVARLGLTTTTQLVTALVINGLFRCDDPTVRTLMKETWTHSVRVGAISAIIARMVPHLNPETALLAGLVHDIGSIAVLARAGSYTGVARDRAVLESAVAALREQVGSMVLRSWAFPTEFITVALDAEDWYRNPDGEADYADVVLVSQILSFVATGDLLRCPALPSLPAFHKLASGELTPGSSLAVIGEAEEEIADLMAILSG